MKIHYLLCKNNKEVMKRSGRAGAKATKVHVFLT
jgi:hypothetical protein